MQSISETRGLKQCIAIFKCFSLGEFTQGSLSNSASDEICCQLNSTATVRTTAKENTLECLTSSSRQVLYDYEIISANNKQLCLYGYIIDHIG